MRTDVFQRLKTESKDPEGLQKNIVAEVSSLMKDDMAFFEGLLQFGEALRMTIHKDKEQTEKERASQQLVYINMIYTILKAFDSSGFVRIVPKVERIAENALRDYQRNI